ncbi:uncharacterized protein [Amphiura filiformis]|uniref:uncharacterized protein n=1 Tax=Amphiura filiformis TaxID=82378 RepID=UPI003B224A9C
MAGAMRSSRPPKSNITREERRAISELKNDKSLLVLPADEGKATVIMEVSEYEDKLSELLNDERTYEQLSSDPTQKYKKELVSTLSKLKKEDKITRSQYDLLYPMAETIPRIYGTPKIHKPSNKVRPIVDYTGSIGYQTSRALADILAPLVGGTDCRPRLWKRYVDDILEIVKEDQVDNLTSHLNQSDPTERIKFTYEKEHEGTIPFLDTLIVKKTDGSVKLLVYRKVTYTDQYLNFDSHYPIHHKLGVIRTLLDRMDNVVTEDEDKKLEEEKIRQALGRCGYPGWSFKKMKDKMANKHNKPNIKKDSTSNPTKGFVVIPYVEGLADKSNRVFRKHGIATAMKPNTTLHKMLVHPKDKIDPLNTSDCVYEIPCAKLQSLLCW